MGNFETARPSPATRRALAELLAWEADRHDLGPRGSHTYRNPESGHTRRLPWIAGHRDADTTSCPGDYLYRALPKVRRDAAAVMGAGKASTSVATTASASRIVYGETVTVGGTLSDENGIALSSRTIRTYVREGKGDWVEGPTTTTAADGTFALTLQPKANVRVVAIYDGDPSTWGNDDEVRVNVAPALTLQPQGGTVTATGAYHYPAGTTQIPFLGSVAPRHEGRTVEVRLAKMGSDGTFTRIDEGSAQIERSGFVFDWTVVDPGVGGTYHAHAFLPKHNDHTWGASPVVTFVIDPQP
jgi:hypothetical protein